mmetsp:Transcript_1921/g.4595  ORF Transcript_1921/g.4595 Transcript_1921/m.4595 type:complete len:120 (-) Transcript_1921:332-691(-)
MNPETSTAMTRVNSVSSLVRMDSQSLSPVEPTTGRPFRSDSLGSMSDSFRELPQESPSTMLQYRKSRHNPVVAAMLSSNMMRDCHQVRDMFVECMSHDSSASICDTAKNYFVQCASNRK